MVGRGGSVSVVTAQEWLDLRTGDFIVENRSGTRRRVIHLTRCTKRGVTRTGISLLKIVRRRWTPGPLTTYFNTDDRGRWRKE